MKRIGKKFRVIGEIGTGSVVKIFKVEVDKGNCYYLAKVLEGKNSFRKGDIVDFMAGEIQKI